MRQEAFVVIMAGGTGTRFWPHSKEDHPKQFLDILGIGKSLLQMTVDRFEAILPAENIFISTNERYADLVQQQLPSLTKDQLLLEPDKRNTAPCIAYACYKIAAKNPEAPIIIAPSDHAIFNDAAFQAAIDTAFTATDDKKLITIGIQPTRPATGYGYINYQSSDNPIKTVISFTEKPDEAKAKELLESGDYVWNAGIFVWSGNAILNAFQKHLPAMAKLFGDMAPMYYTNEESDVIKKQYLLSENISIDYGILEKSEHVHVVLGEFDWSDLGSWASLHENSKKDSNQNAIRGEAITYDVKDSLIFGQERKMMVVEGLENYVIVDTPDSLLIYTKGKEKIVKQAIDQMKSTGRDQHL